MVPSWNVGHSTFSKPDAHMMPLAGEGQQNGTVPRSWLFFVLRHFIGSPTRLVEARGCGCNRGGARGQHECGSFWFLRTCDTRDTGQRERERGNGEGESARRRSILSSSYFCSCESRQVEASSAYHTMRALRNRSSPW